MLNPFSFVWSSLSCEWMEKGRGTEHRADKSPLILLGKLMLIFKDSPGIRACVGQPCLKLMFHGVDSL